MHVPPSVMCPDARKLCDGVYVCDGLFTPEECSQLAWMARSVPFPVRCLHTPRAEE